MISAWRNLLKNKVHVLINLFGLTLGLTVCFFILLFVKDELAYERHIPGNERVFRLQIIVRTAEGDQPWATSEGFILPMMASQYPEIEAGTRVLRSDREEFLRSDSEGLLQDGIVAVDSGFFKVFPLEFIYGDRQTAMNGVDGVVITREVALKFFGDTDPVGKIFSAPDYTMVVKGVVEDIPLSSHFHFKVACPIKSWWPDIDQARGAQAFYTYIRLKDGISVETFGSKIGDWYTKHGDVDASGNPSPNKSRTIIPVAMPITKIHLESHGEKEFEANGQLQLVYIFIAVGLLLIFIAAINYINLSNAIALRRAKEVAIRKTIGASRQKLFVNFIFESYAFTTLALIIAFILVIAGLPEFNLFTGKELDWTSALSEETIPIVCGAWIFLGFMAGFYPATILSSFDPIHALKAGATSRSNPAGRYLRQGLIIAQFTISALLMVGAFTVQRQLSFIDNRDIGFQKENVVVVRLSSDAHQKYNILKNELSRIPGVASVGATSAIPSKRVVFLRVRIPDLGGTASRENGEDDGTRTMRTMGVDAGFIPSLGIEVMEGRNFLDNVADSAGAFIVNEAAVKEYNLKNPIGTAFEYTMDRDPKVGKIVGVVKDFNFASVHSKIEPMVMHVHQWSYSSMCVRIVTQNTVETLNAIEKTWNATIDRPFSFQFLDTAYDTLYKTERSTGKVITLFTMLALVIATMGLFGIVSFFVAQRTKEVGIRKVFGATRSSLVSTLSKEYLVMVIIGNAIAIYPGWLVVNQWLQQFAYKIELSFTTFAAAFVISELLAFMSIIFVILKIVRTNPANILRHE